MNWKRKTFYEDKVIVQVKKEKWDEMWHAFYWVKDTHESMYNRLTYVRVKEKVALKMFANLL